MLGRNLRSRGRSRCNNRSYVFLLAEAVGNTYAQHTVVLTGVQSFSIANVVNPLVFQTGSDVTGHCPLYATSEYWGNTGIVVFEAIIGFSIGTPYHTTQTGVDINVVSHWVAQFSGQLNALRFESTVDIAAFVRLTT